MWHINWDDIFFCCVNDTITKSEQKVKFGSRMRKNSLIKEYQGGNPIWYVTPIKFWQMEIYITLVPTKYIYYGNTLIIFRYHLLYGKFVHILCAINTLYI